MKNSLIFLLIVLVWCTFLFTCGDNPFKEPSAGILNNDTTLFVGDSLIIEGEGYHKNGKDLTFEWFCPSADSLLVPDYNDQKRAIFHANAPGMYSVCLTVISNKDEKNTSPPSIISIHVLPEMSYDVVIKNSDTTVCIKDTVILSCTTTNDLQMADLIHYYWYSKPGGTFLENDSSSILFTADTAANYIIFVRAYSEKDTGEASYVMINFIKPIIPKVKAIAEYNTLVSISDTVYLDAAKSTDSSAVSLRFKWEALSGGSLLDSASPQAKFISHSSGLYLVSLIVSDSADTSNYDRIVLKIEVTKDKPIANAGRDTIIWVDSTIRLNGTQSVSNSSTTLSYFWHSIFSECTLSDTTDSMPRITSSVTNTYPISLVVFNGKFYSDTDWVFVTVRDSSTGLIALPGPSCTTSINTGIQLNGSESIVINNVPVLYTWSIVNGGSFDDPDTSSPIFTGTKAKMYLVALQVYTDKDTSEKAFATVLVMDPQVPPVIKLNAPESVHVNQQITLDASESYDPNDDSIFFHWECLDGGIILNSDSTHAKFSSDKTGNYVLLVTVTDQKNASSQEFFTIAIIDTQLIPIADAGEYDTLAVGDSIQLDGSGSYDPNGDGITYLWDTPDGGGALSSSTAQKPWFKATVTGDYIITLYVYDANSKSLIDWVKITVKDTLVIPDFPPTAVISGNDTSYMILEIDSIYLDAGISIFAPNTAHTFIWKSAGNNPETVSLDSVAKPSFIVSTPGVYTFFLTVFDGYFYSRPVQRTLTIYKPKLYVSNSPNTPWAYQTIVKALEDAEAEDTILIGRGTYNENITVTISDVTFLGMDKNNCIVDSMLNSSANAAIFTLDHANNIVIKQLTLIHGTKDSCGAILMVNCANTVIEDNNLVYNNTDAIRAFNSGTIYVRRNNITHSTYNGIRAINSSLIISNNTFENNGLNLYAETADIALESNDGKMYTTEIRNNSINGLNSSTFKKDQIKILSPMNVTIDGNNITTIDRYSIYCTPTSNVNILSVTRNQFRNTQFTSMFCFEVDSLFISNNHFIVEIPYLPAQKAMDLVNCFKGTIERDTIENFWVGIQTDNTPPGGYQDSLVIKYNYFVNDSTGIFAKGTKAPHEHDNQYPGCVNTVVDSTGTY